MKNFTRKPLVSILLVIPLLFVLIFLTNSAQALALELPIVQPDTKDVLEPTDQEDINILLEYGELLNEEQLAVLETAFAQMKESITAAEKVYQDAIKSLKDRYRVTAQDAVRAIDDDKELAAVIDRLKSEILANYAEIQKILDGDVSTARSIFQKTVDAVRIPAEITDTVISWHLNKELNTANELINFVESFMNLSGDENNNSQQGQGNGSVQQNLTQNSEQNQETNQNQNEQQNTEQKQQQEQNGQSTQSQGQQQGQSLSNEEDSQGQQQGQSQSNEKNSKGKGKSGN